MNIMRDRTNSVKPHPVDAIPVTGTNVLFDVWLTSRAVTGLIDAALAPTGLTADEFGVYSVLTSTEWMTPSELAVWVSAPATTVSSYVKRLQQRGHLERRRNPADGRSFVIRLTPSGRSAHRAAGKAFLPVLRRVVAALGDDEPAVRGALTRLRVAVEDVGSTGRS
jgi:DNA-binding MarR family transcriptional regulator